MVSVLLIGIVVSCEVWMFQQHVSEQRVASDTVHHLE